MSFEKGQKLLHLTTNKDGQPHIEIITFKKEGNYHDDENDLDFIDVIFVEEDIDFVYPSDIYTREQILEKFEIGGCVCQSSPPGVALSDGTCGNCGGVVGLDFYNESMERRYNLRICPECGHENRHPNNYCDKCTKYLEPLSKMIKCPKCGEIARKGNRCDHCKCSIPICYGVVGPRTQDCANCVHTVECLEEQKRPVIFDDPGMDEPMMKTWNCPRCERVELIIYQHCLSCGFNQDDVVFPSDPPRHKLKYPSDELIELAKAAESILCPNCKQPVGHKYEHSDDAGKWWKCPDVGSEEEDQ